MLVHDFLRNSTQKTPDKTALIFGTQRLSYAQFGHAAQALAGFLSSNGLERGDRVVIYAGNQPETAISIFGVLQAGGCFSVVNPGVREAKLRKIFANAEPRFVVTPKEAEPLVESAAAELAQPPVLLYTDYDRAETGIPAIFDCFRPFQGPRMIDDDLAAIIYTSGSTGDPKGVTMTHRNMVAASTSITSYLENRSDDVILNMLPFSFDYGLYQLIMAMQIGATLVVEPTFAFPYQIIELIRKHEVTGLPLVPTIMAILLQLEAMEKETFPTVRYISNTAAPLPPAYVPRLQKAFPKARIFSMYGLTECKRVSYLPPEHLDEKPSSVGIAMPNLEVMIVDDKGVEVPRGKVGELVVRGATVMRGYWRDPEATARRLKPGKYPWEQVLHTGDLFSMDDEGYLYFVARTDDIIKCRGERVHPKEIEDALYLLEDVLHARVVGVPDELCGQAIRAEIVLREGSTLDEKGVLAHCRQHLEPALIPQAVAIVPSLSLTDSGKIRRTVDDVLGQHVPDSGGVAAKSKKTRRTREKEQDI